jgi:histidine ammonia-lyase
MKAILLDGVSLTRAQLVAVANGATVELDPGALQAVARAADFLAAQVARGEPLYGISTGFGSNADKLLPADGRLREQLQHNLIVTHAVCVGEPFAADVVRAMLCIRINTLLRGHSGIRFVAIRGEDEAARGVVAVKDLRRGEQFEVAEAGLVAALREVDA